VLTDLPVLLVLLERTDQLVLLVLLERTDQLVLLVKVLLVQLVL
jgi:hypothetical protein